MLASNSNQTWAAEHFFFCSLYREALVKEEWNNEKQHRRNDEAKVELIES